MAHVADPPVERHQFSLFRSPQANLVQATHRRLDDKQPCDCAFHLNARATMRSPLLAILSLALACAHVATAGDTITDFRIKVQLFAAPAFFSEVSVDAYNNQCLSLDNNL